MMKATGMILAVFAGLFMAAQVAQADSVVYTLDQTDTISTNYSSALNVSGWIDKIELTQDSAATCTVTVATYNGTTAIDTIASATFSTPTLVIRPRAVGTTSAGVALTFGGAAGSTNVTQLLTVPYDRVMGGGNILVKTINGLNDGTNSFGCRVYYSPTR